MTIRELLEKIAVGDKENLTFRFYEYKSKKEYVFHNENEIKSFVSWSNCDALLDSEIEYFSFRCSNFKFELAVRIKE